MALAVAPMVSPISSVHVSAPAVERAVKSRLVQAADDFLATYREYPLIDIRDTLSVYPGGRAAFEARYGVKMAVGMGTNREFRYESVELTAEADGVGKASVVMERYEGGGGAYGDMPCVTTVYHSPTETDMIDYFTDDEELEYEDM